MAVGAWAARAAATATPESTDGRLAAPCMPCSATWSSIIRTTPCACSSVKIRRGGGVARSSSDLGDAVGGAPSPTRDPRHRCAVARPAAEVLRSVEPTRGGDGDAHVSCEPYRCLRRMSRQLRAILSIRRQRRCTDGSAHAAVRADTTVRGAGPCRALRRRARAGCSSSMPTTIWKARSTSRPRHGDRDDAARRNPAPGARGDQRAGAAREVVDILGSTGSPTCLVDAESA